MSHPMVSDKDVYRSAKLLVDQHGDGAPLRAAVSAERCRKVGNGEGATVWLRIMKAVEKLFAEQPTETGQGIIRAQRCW